MNSFKNRSIAGTAALVATFVTVAMATPLRAQPVEVKVAYGDLDVTSQAGATELHGRIYRAAAQVCGHRTLSTLSSVAACRREAAAAAQGKVAITDAGFKLAAR